MKNKFLYIYYFVLILILILYTNTSHSPNAIIRLGYLAALVVPLLNNIALFPAVILCALCISKNTFAYPFMPTEMYYYVLSSMAFVFLAIQRKKTIFTIRPLFLVILSYVAINDFLFQGSLTPLVTMLFLMVLMYFCSACDLNISKQFLPYTFIFLSIAISYWILFCPEAKINTYNVAEGMEQAGWRDPNYIACALGTGLVVAVRELLHERQNKYSLVLLLVTIIASTLALLLIASRGMTIATAISVGIMMLFSKVRKRTKVLTIIALSLFMVFLYTNQYFDFVMARFYSDDGTAGQRTTIWVTKLDAFFSESNLINYLFGYGQLGGFRLGYGNLVSTHNDYISILIYYGFIGVALFVAACAYPLKVCSKTIKPQIIAMLIYLLICSISIEPLSSGNIAYIGLFFYITQLARHSRK